MLGRWGAIEVIDSLADGRQSSAKGSPPAHLVAIGPEEGRELVACVPAAFYEEVDEDCEGLARGKEKLPLTVADLRCAEQLQAQLRHWVSSFTFFSRCCPKVEAI